MRNQILALAVVVFGLACTPLFAGDTCPASYRGDHSGSYDSYGFAADFTGTINHLLYYDYITPSGNIVDSTQSGCETPDPPVLTVYGAPYDTAYLFSTGIDWANNNTCPTITGCNGFPPDPSDRMVIAIYTTTTAAPYVSKLLVDTATVPVGNTVYRFDNSVGNGRHQLFTMPKPNITGAACDGTTCRIGLSITLPTFDGTGATGGLYGDNATVAQNLLVGYKIVAMQSATPPANGVVGGTNWTKAIADTDRYIPITRPPAGGTVTRTFGGADELTIDVSGDSNPLYIAYVPIFDTSLHCAANPCSLTDLQALDTLGLTGKIASPASTRIAPTPVRIKYFTGKRTGIRRITLNWETATEVDAAGFILYRSRDGSAWTRVNGELIPARGQGGAGARYEYVDENVPRPFAGQWFYKLEEISNNNVATELATTKIKPLRQ